MAKTRSMSRSLNHNDVASSSSSSSRKRFKTSDKDDVAPWSDVDHDVLFLIMMQLGVVDFIAFSGVCKSWRSLALANKKMFMSFKPPLSISIEPRDSNQDSYCHLKDVEERMFKTILPCSAGRSWFGLTCGYLILFGRENRDFWLVNPITRHELHFPDYPLYVRVMQQEMKAILVFSPSISRWVLIILYEKLSFCIGGKRGWNHVSTTLPVVDLHFFKGKIYTVHTDCSLSELRLNPNRKPRWTTFTLLKTNNYPNQKPRELVSSGENLYMISRFPYKKKVLELDVSEMKWASPEKSIEEYAFFFSYYSSSAAFKVDSWADPQRQHKSYEYYFLDDDKIRKCMFLYKGIWYFPHDCLNVNLLDEE